MILFRRRSHAKQTFGLSARRVGIRLAFILTVLIPCGVFAFGGVGVNARGVPQSLNAAPPCPSDPPPPPTCDSGLPCLPDTGGGFCDENPGACADGNSSGSMRLSHPQAGVLSPSVPGIAGVLLPSMGIPSCPGNPPPGGTAPEPTPVPPIPVCADCEAPGVAARVETPTVRVRMNPEPGLVNLPTWLWAEGYRGQDLFASQSWSPPYEPTTIAVRYSVKRYLWNFGDGGQIEARSLGQPYPQESDIRNAYGWSSRTEPGEVFHLALTIEWAVEYRVNGGPPQSLPPALRRYEATYPVQELQPIITNP